MRITWALPVLCGLGCIVPVGPDFQDAEPLLPPYIVNATPAIGTVVTRTGDDVPTFEITTADPNVDEPLFLRVIYNFPPYNHMTSRSRTPAIVPPSASRSEIRAPFRFRPNCQNDALPVGQKQHRLLVLISDRQFLSEREEGTLSNQEVYTAVPKDARVAIAQWTLDMECR